MLVEGRLKREMENLEKYLRSAGGDAIIAMIDAGSEEGQLFLSRLWRNFQVGDPSESS